MILLLFSFLAFGHAADSMYTMHAHRVAWLSRTLGVLPDAPGAMPRNFPLQLEVVRDWQARGRNVPADIDKQVDEVEACHRSIGEAEYTSGQDFSARLQRCTSLWLNLGGIITEYPWSSLDWSRVFADRVADMELRVARRLNVDPVDVYQLTEHALESLGGWKALVRSLQAGPPWNSNPLYSKKTLAILIEEAKAVSPSLVRTLKLADAPFRESEAWNAKFELGRDGGITNFIDTDYAIKFTFGPHDLPSHRRRSLDESLADYRRAIIHVSNLGSAVAQLNESNRRDDLLRILTNFERELKYEVATLPARYEVLEHNQDSSRRPIHRAWNDSEWQFPLDSSAVPNVMKLWREKVARAGIRDCGALLRYD